jgi:site-specific DNA-cytosine methylase
LERADYACWPLIIGADDIGAPHRRKRLWLICARRDVSTRLARVAKEKPWIHMFKTP